MGGHGREARGKAAQISIRLEVTLEEMYNGNVAKTVEYKRTSFCSQCNGEGGPKECQEMCSHCNGRGRTESYLFLGVTTGETVNKKSTNSNTKQFCVILCNRSVRLAMDMEKLYQRLCAAPAALEKV